MNKILLRREDAIFYTEPRHLSTVTVHALAILFNFSHHNPLSLHLISKDFSSAPRVRCHPEDTIRMASNLFTMTSCAVRSARESNSEDTTFSSFTTAFNKKTLFHQIILIHLIILHTNIEFTKTLLEHLNNWFLFENQL